MRSGKISDFFYFRDAPRPYTSRGGRYSFYVCSFLKEENMRVLLASLMMLAVGLVLLGGVEGGEKDKVVVLKGSITCAKCDLGKETTCMTVIVAKNKDKK